MRKLTDILEGNDTEEAQTLDQAEQFKLDTPEAPEPVAEAHTTEMAVAAPQTTAMALPSKKSALEALAEEKLRKIQEANPDFHLDFMNVFTRMKTNTKGQFTYSLAGEDFVLSDKINTRLLAGDYMHQRWGDKDTDQEGQLVCYSKDGQQTSIDGHICAECPYGRDKCSLRFAIALNVLRDGEDPDEIFNINLPSTGAFAFVDYVKLLYKKFKKGVKDVVTEMRTEEKDGKNKGDKFNAIMFRVSQ